MFQVNQRVRGFKRNNKLNSALVEKVITPSLVRDGRMSYRILPGYASCREGKKVGDRTKGYRPGMTEAPRPPSSSKSSINGRRPLEDVRELQRARASKDMPGTARNNMVLDRPRKWPKGGNWNDYYTCDTQTKPPNPPPKKKSSKIRRKERRKEEERKEKVVKTTGRKENRARKRRKLAVRKKELRGRRELDRFTRDQLIRSWKAEKLLSAAVTRGNSQVKYLELLCEPENLNTHEVSSFQMANWEKISRRGIDPVTDARIVEGTHTCNFCNKQYKTIRNWRNHLLAESGHKQLLIHLLRQRNWFPPEVEWVLALERPYSAAQLKEWGLHSGLKEDEEVLLANQSLEIMDDSLQLSFDAGPVVRKDDGSPSESPNLLEGAGVAPSGVGTAAQVSEAGAQKVVEDPLVASFAGEDDGADADLLAASEEASQQIKKSEREVTRVEQHEKQEDSGEAGGADIIVDEAFSNDNSMERRARAQSCSEVERRKRAVAAEGEPRRRCGSVSVKRKLDNSVELLDTENKEVSKADADRAREKRRRMAQHKKLRFEKPPSPLGGVLASASAAGGTQRSRARKSSAAGGTPTPTPTPAASVPDDEIEMLLNSPPSAEVQTLRESVTKLEDEVLSLKGQLAKWEKIAKGKEDEVTEERTKTASAESKLQQERIHTENLMRTIRDGEAKIVKLKAERETLRCTILQEKQGKNKLYRDLAVSEADAEMAEVTAERATVRQDCSHDRHQLEMQDLRDMLEEKTDELADLKVELERQRGLTDLTKIKLVAAEEKFQLVKNSTEEHKITLKENIKILSDARKEIKLLEGIVAKLRGQLLCPKDNCSGKTYGPRGMRDCPYQHNAETIRERKIQRNCSFGITCNRGLACRFVHPCERFDGPEEMAFHGLNCIHMDKEFRAMEDETDEEAPSLPENADEVFDPEFMPETSVSGASQGGDDETNCGGAGVVSTSSAGVVAEFEQAMETSMPSSSAGEVRIVVRVDTDEGSEGQDEGGRYANVPQSTSRTFWFEDAAVRDPPERSPVLAGNLDRRSRKRGSSPEERRTREESRSKRERSERSSSESDFRVDREDNRRRRYQVSTEKKPDRKSSGRFHDSASLAPGRFGARARSNSSSSEGEGNYSGGRRETGRAPRNRGLHDKVVISQAQKFTRRNLSEDSARRRESEMDRPLPRDRSNVENSRRLYAQEPMRRGEKEKHSRDRSPLESTRRSQDSAMMEAQQSPRRGEKEKERAKSGSGSEDGRRADAGGYRSSSSTSVSSATRAATRRRRSVSPRKKLVKRRSDQERRPRRSETFDRERERMSRSEARRDEAAMEAEEKWDRKERKRR